MKRRFSSHKHQSYYFSAIAGPFLLLLLFDALLLVAVDILGTTTSRRKDQFGPRARPVPSKPSGCVATVAFGTSFKSLSANLIAARLCRHSVIVFDLPSTTFFSSRRCAAATEIIFFSSWKKTPCFYDIPQYAQFLLSEVLRCVYCCFVFEHAQKQPCPTWRWCTVLKPFPLLPFINRDTIDGFSAMQTSRRCEPLLVCEQRLRTTPFGTYCVHPVRNPKEESQIVKYDWPPSSWQNLVSLSRLSIEIAFMSVSSDILCDVIFSTWRASTHWRKDYEISRLQQYARCPWTKTAATFRGRSSAMGMAPSCDDFNVLRRRGPTAFDLRAILQKR